MWILGFEKGIRKKSEGSTVGQKVSEFWRYLEKEKKDRDAHNFELKRTGKLLSVFLIYNFSEHSFFSMSSSDSIASASGSEL